MTIQLIENKSEIGAGTRGASLGIDALRIAGLNKKNDYFSKHKVITIKDKNSLLFDNIKLSSAKRIKGISEVFQIICDQVDETISNNKFPLILAADHSSAGGTIAGIKKKYPNKRLGAIWIDAHADLHSPYTSPTGNVHGMPLATAIGLDNKECKVKEPSAEAIKYWEKLKETGGISPKILSNDVVFFGVRDTEFPEDEIIRREGIKNFTVAETREKGIDKACSEALELLSDCDIIYISFDVDSMDCDLVSMGTGTPVPNGYTPTEANSIIQGLIKSEKLVCFEMVEINPTLDNKQNLMADTAFEILVNTTNTLEKKVS
jgi:arginase|tara:strand:- start:596 stop:1552 length:957 start_codon:yes stop_codon:yes gene_type:complete